MLYFALIEAREQELLQKGTFLKYSFCNLINYVCFILEEHDSIIISSEVCLTTSQTHHVTSQLPEQFSHVYSNSHSGMQQ